MNYSTKRTNKQKKLTQQTHNIFSMCSVFLLFLGQCILYECCRWLWWCWSSLHSVQYLFSMFCFSSHFFLFFCLFCHMIFGLTFQIFMQLCVCFTVLCKRPTGNTQILYSISILIHVFGEPQRRSQHTKKNAMETNNNILYVRFSFVCALMHSACFALFLFRLLLFIMIYELWIFVLYMLSLK